MIATKRHVLHRHCVLLVRAVFATAGGCVSDTRTDVAKGNHGVDAAGRAQDRSFLFGRHIVRSRQLIFITAKES
jgi:hypothetical protein